MVDFRLKVFVCVARHQSFTRAAQELFVSQPAVTNHIAELERQTGLMLFSRRGRSIELTAEGRKLLLHAERIMADYKAMTDEVSELSGRQGGQLTIGASTSIAQYVLPSLLARFNSRYPDIGIQLFSGNTQNIELMLQNESVDLGMIEGMSSRMGFRYDDFRHDSIVLVAGGDKRVKISSVEQLRTMPVVMREDGSGTLDVVACALRDHGVRLNELNIVMRIGSTEGIKRYVQNSDAVAFVSQLTIENELKLGLLKVIDIPGLDIARKLQFVRLQGKQNKPAEIFMQFASADKG